MLANKSLIDAMNAQVANELGASNQYLAIASYFDRESLVELSRFFFRQSDEERVHALKFVKFINEVDGELSIGEIPEQRSNFSSAAEAVELALGWEQTVTEQIYGLVDIAKNDSNYIAMRFLDWFVTEQLEEVSTMSTLLAVIRRAGEANLLLVEQYLAREGARLVADGGDEA